jgi:hypothetical protein
VNGNGQGIVWILGFPVQGKPLSGGKPRKLGRSLVKLETGDKTAAQDNRLR